MTYYVPGTEEKDPAKIIMSLQQVHGNTATNTTNIATNTANIATNTAAIAAIVVPSAATKANQQAGSSNAVFVAPLHQQDHDSAVKAWGQFTQSAGTYTNAASYNVASFTKNSTGLITINFTTAFASTSFAVVFSANQSTPATVQEVFSSRSASSIQVTIQSVGTTPAVTDLGFSFSAMGRQ